MKLLSIVSTLILLLTSCGENSDVLFFDANLESCVREKIFKPYGYLSFDDVKRVKFLSCSKKKIKSIKGIGKLKNLEELLLHDNEIIDISPLKNLTKLTWLELTTNKISNITYLSSLRNLEQLGFGENFVSELNSIINLEKITKLYTK